MKNANGMKMTIKDESYYEVQLARTVVVRGRTLSPMFKNTLIGKLVKTLNQEDIVDVKPIA